MALGAALAVPPGGYHTTDDLVVLLDLCAVAFGGEFSLTVINYIGLLFSFVHISYLCTMVLARGSVVLFFSWLKGKEARRNRESAKIAEYSAM